MPPITSEGDTVIVTPAHSTHAIVNPGKGWVLYGAPQSQPPEVLALGGLGYARYRWGTIEPEEGHYNWEIIDRDIEAWSKLGKQFAFGVACASSHSKDFWVTPQWVFDAGAKYLSYELLNANPETSGTPGRKLIPVFDDPVFLRKLGNFLRAMAARYDGKPEIAFIDIRSYGNWGEGHMGFSAPFKLEELAPEKYREHLQLHRDAFHKTLLQVCCGMKRYASELQWAADSGIGMRRDGICGNSDGSDVLPGAGKSPAVFESYGTYEMMVQRGSWYGKKDEKGRGYRLEDCVETGQPTYCDLSRGGQSGLKLLTEEPALVNELANRLGYHFVFTEARYPKTAAAGRPIAVSVSWENRWVAPIYIPASVSFALLNAAGEVVAVAPAAAMNPAALKSDTPVTLSDALQFANVAPGAYSLAVGMLQPRDGLKPSIQLGVELDCVDGWYALGPITLH